MKYFLDTEFIEAGYKHPLELLSIGIVSADDRMFYAENSEANLEHAGEWVKTNVLPKFKGLGFTRQEIKDKIIEFVGNDPAPEFWAYYADYDWVVFCQIFGTMVDLPKNFPMWCRDIKQFCSDMGNPQLAEQVEGEHNALDDAMWNRAIYRYLRELQ